MRITNKMRKKASNAIIRYLSENKSATRVELIEGALLTYGLSKSELENYSPKSKGSVIRSYLSTALSDLINKQDVKREGEKYMLAKDEIVIIREDECEKKIDSDGTEYWWCSECDKGFDEDGYEYWPDDEEEE